MKLSEAMFDMKAQLQMMEAQVASIAKQKESLERTLQAKAQYIRVRKKIGAQFLCIGYMQNVIKIP